MRLKSKTGIWITACVTLVAAGMACTGNKTTQQATQTKAGAESSTAPAGTTAMQSDTALVRFVNATDRSADLYFGDTKTFSDVAFKTVTPYRQVPAKRQEYKFRLAGENNDLTTDSESPLAGKHYTVLAVQKEDGASTLKMISDDLSQPDPGKAKIRVIHAAAGARDVDVYPAGTNKALMSGVGFDHATDYKEVDPMITELDVRQNGSKSDRLKIKDIKLNADRFYTILIFGGHGRKLSSETIEDQLMGG